MLAALLTFVVAAGTASAQRQSAQRSHEATPCWKVLTNDAFDGKVDGIYPSAVYGEAIQHLPTDVQSYSTIADVITRARQAALQQAGKGVKADPARCGYAFGDKSGGASNTGGGTSDGLVPGVIDKGASSADGFPVALIVIAIVAALLVLGGGAGFIVRRRQRSQAELDAASGLSGADDDGPRELGP